VKYERENGSDIQNDPEGIEAISRWLSEATPPVTENKKTHPGRGASDPRRQMAMSPRPLIFPRDAILPETSSGKEFVEESS
jgi:hypothetical protein